MAGELPSGPTDGNGPSEGDGTDRPQRRRGPESVDDTSARHAAFLADLQERRQKNVEGLGLSAEDIGVLDERFDWDMHALVEWKRARSEKLPEALESFGRGEDAPEVEPSRPFGPPEPVGEKPEAERHDASSVTENPERYAAIVNREVQIGQRVADFLDANELAGGHTLDKHVGREAEYLAARAKSLSGGEASAFYDRIHAEAALSHALSDATWSKAIDSWLAGDAENKQKLVVSADVPGPAGMVVLENGETHTSSTVHAVLLRTDYGFRIHTAYLK